jgi:hypothetical protein
VEDLQRTGTEHPLHNPAPTAHGEATLLQLAHSVLDTE